MTETVKKNHADLLALRKPYQVSVYYKICKYLPFEVTNKRVKGWEHSRSLPDGSTLKMIAHETISPGDIFVLIAAIKLFQDYSDMVVRIEKKDNIELAVTVSYAEFTKKYIKHNNYHKLLQTLIRLSSFQAIWEKIDGSVKTHRYLYDFAIDSGRQNITLTISEAFADFCIHKGWLINFSKLQQVSSPTSRALFLYFSTNHGERFNQATLEKWLDMPQGNSINARDNRKQIKRALNDLKDKGILNDYKYENDGFTIVHSSHKKRTPPPHEE